VTQPRQARRYDSSGRQAQARQNRERILAVATRLFVAQGYAGTSIAQIAAGAGVSAPTVFAGFRSKPNLLKEAVDVAVVGDDEPVPLAQRPVMHRVLSAATAAEAVERIADLAVDVIGRTARLYSVVYRAADGDPEIAALARTLDEQRLTGAERMAGVLARLLGTGDPARIAEIRDVIWTLDAPDVHTMLVGERGWTVERYRDWLARALAGTIL